MSVRRAEGEGMLGGGRGKRRAMRSMEGDERRSDCSGGEKGTRGS